MCIWGTFGRFPAKEWLFSSSSQPRHWLLSFKCWWVVSSTMWKLFLLFLLSLHNWLPEVCNELVRFLFKHLLSYIPLVPYALLPNIFVTSSPEKSPWAPNKQKVSGEYDINWANLMFRAIAMYFTGTALFGLLLLKLKQCVKFPTSISTPFSVFRCTRGYWQYFWQFFIPHCSPGSSWDLV